MDDAHPPDDMLRRLVAGTASRDEGRQIALHLLHGCRTCGNRLREILSPPIPEGAYDAALDRLETARLRGAAGVSAPAEKAAIALLAELDAQPPSRQEILVHNSRRYLCPHLARLLAERSFEMRYQDPRLMLRAARQAATIADRLAGATPGEAAQLADLRALCASQLCSALRITGDLGGAERAMKTTLAALKQGTGDAILRGLVSERLGALRKWQCRYAAAISAYEEATEIFRDLGRRHELASALVGQAIATFSEGDPEGALALLFEAIPKIEGERDPRLTLAACHAVVSCQISTGHVEDASLKWIELRFLYEQIGDPLLRLRENWLEGKLLIAQGVIPAGIRLLEKTREAYRKKGMAYDAAVIVLEIAQGHLRLGHLDRVRALISEILPVFRELEVGRDVLAEFVLLRRAAWVQSLSWTASAGPPP